MVQSGSSRYSLYLNLFSIVKYLYGLLTSFSSDGNHPHIHHYYNYHPPGRMHHVRISIGAPSGTIVNVSYNSFIFLYKLVL